MDSDMKFRLNKFDKLTLYNGNTLILEDGSTKIICEIGWENARLIMLKYLQQADDYERTQIWHELYDDLSYEELEDKYLEATNEVDNLKEEIENLRQSKDRKVFDY